ncbi:MAG: SGNH/GDSL hydrolase family protein [Candidatus Omnitrophica bacterium]|nr:SGNH/GDSL hydrolase family protein [Candidatus Omnitrophota bacterium]
MSKTKSLLIIVAVPFFLLIIISQALLIDINYWQSDNLIGWKHTPNFSGVFYGPGFKAKVKFNKEGFRDIDHQLENKKGVLRIAVIGDSFVEALQVNQSDMLTTVLEKSLNSVIKSEVMNFGVSSFGTTNEYLTYWAYVKKYRPDFVIIVFSVNDFIDNDKILSECLPSIDLMRHRPYFSVSENGDLVAEEFVPYKKGFLRSALSRVRLLSFLRNAIFRLKAQHARKQQFYTKEMELYSDKYPPEITDCVNRTEAILKKFLLSIFNEGSMPIVCLAYPSYVLDPYRRNLLTQSELDLNKINIDKPLNIIKKLCVSLSVDVIDIRREQLQVYKSALGGLFLKDGHWNENGHKLLATAIEKKIIQKSRDMDLLNN